jgi:N-formylglutamate amidohydrolase
MVCGLSTVGRPVPGAKQRGGLGLIPRRLAGSGDIWKHPITLDELNYRIESYHRPYHVALSSILKRMRDRFGVAILLDVHSMPPLDGVQFVIGDRFGRSTANRYSELLLSRLRTEGFNAALNYPYSGEHILRRHGQVEHNIHAVQLEICRSLYLDPALREPRAKLADIAALVRLLAQELVDNVTGRVTLLAAE